MSEVSTCQKPEGGKEKGEERALLQSDPLTLCYDGNSIVQSSHGAIASNRWPEGCKFYSPATMDGAYLRLLRGEETQYLPKEDAEGNIICLELANSRQAKHVIFVNQKRQYKCVGSKYNKNKIFVDRELWDHVLEKYSIHPQAIELLHDNQGGNARYLSYADITAGKQGPGQTDSNQVKTQAEVSAFHICVKVGDFLGREHFAYARYDFQSHDTVILVVGSHAKEYPEMLRQRIKESKQSDLFCMLLAISSFWYQDMAARRLDLDAGTQYLEAHATGSCFHHLGVNVEVCEQLKLHSSIMTLATTLSIFARASRVIKDTFAFLDQQLLEFDKLCRDQACFTMDPQLVQQISEAFQQKLSLAKTQLPQVEEMRARIEAQAAQLKLASLLVQQRDSRTNLEFASAARSDNRINIEIASAMKMDSHLMKGIAAVSMVFLPGTFMATFFSMTFFNVDSQTAKHLGVSPWLWLYVALTVPMTFGMLLWYWMMNRTANSDGKAATLPHADDCDAATESRRSSGTMIQI